MLARGPSGFDAACIELTADCWIKSSYPGILLYLQELKICMNDTTTHYGIVRDAPTRGLPHSTSQVCRKSLLPHFYKKFNEYMYV